MTFARLLSEALAAEDLPSTEDVLAVGMPMLDQLEASHRAGMVSKIKGLSHVEYDGVSLRFDPDMVQLPKLKADDVARLNPQHWLGGVEVTARNRVDHGLNLDGGSLQSDDVLEADQFPDRAVFMVGYRAWEQVVGHHDELTDIYLTGLLLVSYATGLDLDLAGAVSDLALHRRHLLRLCPNLHPVVAGVLGEMINPDRHARPDDATQVIARLRHHRELPSDLDLTSAYGSSENWKIAVLRALRERVFDTTRRNRTLYFRNSATALSLTDASVPLLLNESRIRDEDLLTWKGTSADAFRSGKPVDLERWCRFEENPYLRPGLEKILSSERKLRAEHGQGRLHIVAAFLRWYDPVNSEVVNSPLLIMPAELTKRKGVHPRYLVEIDQKAEVNPILRHILKSRFDLVLVEEIDSDFNSIKAFVSDLESAIQASEPALRVELIDRPQISLIKRKAQIRVDAYHRRRAQALSSSGRWRRQDHSYSNDDWRPLGLSLYQRFALPTELPLRNLAGAAPKPRTTGRLAPLDNDNQNENGNRNAAALSSDGEGDGDGKDRSASDPDSGGKPGTAPNPGSSTPSGERTTTGYVLSTGDVSAQRWEVDLCSVTLASIGSRRTTISRDYDALLETPAADVDNTFAGTPFATMFSPTPRVARTQPLQPISLDQTLVLPADAAQAVAVRRGVRGDSFIIQGPPGTGKSQTITNLIAALVAENKRVLFVCEKRAALDVVAHRLRQVGLDELVATIHDSQLDRRSFISDLGRTYQQWLERDADDAVAHHHRTLEAAQALLRPLELAFEDLLAKPAGSSLPIAELVHRAVLAGMAATASKPLKSAATSGHMEGADDLTIDAWLKVRPGLDLVTQSLNQVDLDSRLGMNTPFRISPSAFSSGSHLDTVDGVAQGLNHALERLDRATKSAIPPTSISLDWLHALLARRAQLERLDASNAAEVLNSASALHQSLQNARQEQTRLRTEADALSAIQARWLKPLTATDTAAALQVAQAKEGAFFGFLDGRWRSTKKLVEASYNFFVHQVEPTISDVLADLNRFHQSSQAASAFDASVQSTFGSSDLEAIDRLAREVGHHPIPLLVGANPGSASFGEILDSAQLVVDACQSLLVATDATSAELAELAEGLATSSYRYERPLVEWSKLEEAPTSVLLVALGLDTRLRLAPAAHINDRPTLDESEYRLLSSVLDKSSRRGVGAMPGAQLDSAVEALLEIQDDLRSSNAELVAHAARKRFTEHVESSEASMAGRSDEDKAFKRSYTAGRKLLEREFQKKMRFRSIRELASGASGQVVRDLKPIWLMSPLSVSDTLPLDDDLFDAVIFDEASQIPVEDAIPTLFRSRQAIVVGDRMQLPPTRFFSADSDEDDEIIADEDGHRLSISLEADSFLSQADLALDSTMLSWHYRSRFESLIAYSNHAFYDGGLATVPDRAFDQGQQEPLRVDAAEDARQHLDATLNRPISFHKLSHGTYQDRRNEAEADYIAELVRSLLGSDSPLTVGIVAFSEAQQRTIEDALAELATLDQAFRERLEAEQVRSDDDEFVGLFVKNLENVQGDERDIIIMSVCYAPSPEGKMRMNFGPINQSGGERRLNVIFSRAKQHMAIVSSISGSQITNRHNDGAANLAQFLEYAEAESQGQGGVADGLLAALRPNRTESDSEQRRSAVGAAIAGELRLRGFAVDVNVGRSVFTVDVAIRGEDGYLLGVLIDPGPANSDATARLVAEAGVLRAFGWPVTRLLVTEWFDHPDRVIDRIEQMLRAGTH